MYLTMVLFVEPRLSVLGAPETVRVSLEEEGIFLFFNLIAFRLDLSDGEVLGSKGGK